MHLQQQVAEIGGVQRLQPLLVDRRRASRPCRRRSWCASPARHVGRASDGAVLPAVDQAAPASAGGQRFSSMSSASSDLLSSRSWSSVSRIVKLDFSPTSSACGAGSAPIEWNVPSHGMPSTAPPMSVADALAHLARRLVGEGDGEHLARARPCRSARMCASRVVSTRVLPVPAPASTSSGPSVRLDGRALLGVQALEIGRFARRHGPRRKPAGLHRRGWLLVAKVTEVEVLAAHQVPNPRKDLYSNRENEMRNFRRPSGWRNRLES